jgi:hypothetical protein
MSSKKDESAELVAYALFSDKAVYLYNLERSEGVVFHPDEFEHPILGFSSGVIGNPHVPKGLTAKLIDDYSPQPKDSNLLIQQVPIEIVDQIVRGAYDPTKNIEQLLDNSRTLFSDRQNKTSPMFTSEEVYL